MLYITKNSVIVSLFVMYCVQEGLRCELSFECHHVRSEFYACFVMLSENVTWNFDKYGKYSLDLMCVIVAVLFVLNRV